MSQLLSSCCGECWCTANQGCGVIQCTIAPSHISSAISVGPYLSFPEIKGNEAASTSYRGVLGDTGMGSNKCQHSSQLWSSMSAPCESISTVCGRCICGVSGSLLYLGYTDGSTTQFSSSQGQTASQFLCHCLCQHFQIVMAQMRPKMYPWRRTTSWHKWRPCPTLPPRTSKTSNGVRLGCFMDSHQQSKHAPEVMKQGLKESSNPSYKLLYQPTKKTGNSKNFLTPILRRRLSPLTLSPHLKPLACRWPHANPAPSKRAMPSSCRAEETATIRSKVHPKGVGFKKTMCFTFSYQTYSTASTYSM